MATICGAYFNKFVDYIKMLLMLRYFNP